MSQTIQLDHLRPVTEYAPASLTTEPVEPKASDLREGDGDHPLEAEKEDLFDRMRRMFFEPGLRLPASSPGSVAH